MPQLQQRIILEQDDTFAVKNRRITELSKQLEDHDWDAAQELDELTGALLKKLRTRQRPRTGHAAEKARRRPGVRGCAHGTVAKAGLIELYRPSDSDRARDGPRDRSLARDGAGRSERRWPLLVDRAEVFSADSSLIKSTPCAGGSDCLRSLACFSTALAV